MTKTCRHSSQGQTGRYVEPPENRLCREAASNPQRGTQHNSLDWASISPTVHGWLVLCHEHRSAAAAAPRTHATAAASVTTSCGCCRTSQQGLSWSHHDERRGRRHAEHNGICDNRGALHAAAEVLHLALVLWSLCSVQGQQQ